MSTLIAWVSSITVLLLLANDGDDDVAFIGLGWAAVMISALLYVLAEIYGPGVRRDGDEQ